MGDGVLEGVEAREDERFPSCDERRGARDYKGSTLAETCVPERGSQGLRWPPRGRLCRARGGRYHVARSQSRSLARRKRLRQSPRPRHRTLAHPAPAHGPAALVPSLEIPRARHNIRRASHSRACPLAQRCGQHSAEPGIARNLASTLRKAHWCSRSVERYFSRMKSGIRGKLTTMAIAGALAIGFAIAPASPATALGNCTLAQWSKFAQVKCTSRGGHTQVRAAIVCTKWITGSYGHVRFGPWVGVNQTSQAACKWDETPKLQGSRVMHWHEGR